MVSPLSIIIYHDIRADWNIETQNINHHRPQYFSYVLLFIFYFLFLLNQVILEQINTMLDSETINDQSSKNFPNKFAPQFANFLGHSLIIPLLSSANSETLGCHHQNLVNQPQLPTMARLIEDHRFKIFSLDDTQIHISFNH